MATQSYLVSLDLNQNELQNAVIQNLPSAPSNPKEGQIYYNSTSKNYYGYKNGSWVLLDSQGLIYSAGTGIDSTALANGTIKTDTTIASKTDIGSANLTIQRNGTGIGTFSANATSPVTVNVSVPTAATDINAVPNTRTINGYTLTADVTLSASDVGALPSNTTIGDGALTVQRNGIAIGTFKANATSGTTVNVTVPTAVTDLSDASNYALKSDVASAIIPKGSISATSGLPTLTEDHLGWMYNFSAAFTTTSDFVEGSGKKYPAGTNVVVVSYAANTYKYDVFAGFIDTEAIDNHIANTTIHVTATDKSNWNGKQDALTAGSNITISGGTISATDTTYSAGSNISITNGTISATDTTYNAGTGITINSSNTVAVTNLVAKVALVENTALTASGGVCTWDVSLSSGQVIRAINVYKTTNFEEVVTSVTLGGDNTASIKINSASNIAAGTYTAVVMYS